MSFAQTRGGDRVNAALCDALLQQASTVVVAGVVGIPLFAAYEWHRHPDWRLAVWFGIQISILVAIARVGRRYRQRRARGAVDPQRTAAIYTVWLVLGGVFWGLAGAVLFDPRDEIATGFLLVFFGGGAVTALLAAYAHPPAFLGYVGVTLIPLLVRCLETSSMVFRTIGVAIALFVVLCVLAVGRFHRVLLRSAELRFANEDLAAGLKREKSRVEEALLAKSRFLAAASHDLRQPLHALTLYLELLEQRLSGGEEGLFLTRAQSAARALAGLLNALLDISRIDAATVQPRRAHVPLAALFCQLAGELGEAARRKGLALAIADRDLVVVSDPELLGRILRNLLANAVRYTREGSVSLSAVARGPVAVISVADTGPGIPPAEQDNVWREFYQIGNRERDREQGLGLGLSIVRGLCQLLGHPVRLESAPARAHGTEVTIEVPLGSTAQIAPATVAPIAADLTGRRVLVLDDEREIRVAMALLLESWRCEAVAAASVEEALTFAASGPPPDAVICDYRLSAGTTGAEALARLEAHVGAPLPAVFVTGDTSPERIRELRQTGRPLLWKPVLPGKLRAVLSALLAPPETADPA